LSDPTTPLFSFVAAAPGFLTDAEMDRIVDDNAPLLTDGKLGTGAGDSGMRRSRVVFIDREGAYGWLYGRFWDAAEALNREYFRLSISYIEGNIQLARYDSSDHGFYNWHTDFADLAPRRKLSISVQLSRPEDYAGGDLQLRFAGEPYTADQTRGTLVAFPSFTLHRVAPVTQGTRWSLVAWICGRRWR